MATTYRGNRCFYIDDETGLMWDSPQKRQQFNMDTNEPIGKEEPKAIVIDTHTDVTATITEVIKDPLTCDCGYVAKSKAGLAVHRMKHKVS